MRKGNSSVACKKQSKQKSKLNFTAMYRGERGRSGETPANKWLKYVKKSVKRKSKNISSNISHCNQNLFGVKLFVAAKKCRRKKKSIFHFGNMEKVKYFQRITWDLKNHVTLSKFLLLLRMFKCELRLCWRRQLFKAIQMIHKWYSWWQGGKWNQIETNCRLLYTLTYDLILRCSN